jgi:hypothetical protein
MRGCSAGLANSIGWLFVRSSAYFPLVKLAY